MTISAYHFPGVNAVQGAVGCAAIQKENKEQQVDEAGIQEVLK